MIKLHYAGHFHGAQMVDWHSHEAPELIYQTVGSCRHRFGDCELETSVEQIILIPRGTPHLQESVTEAATLYLVLELPAAELAKLPAPLVTTGGDPFAGRWFRMVHELWHVTHPARAEMLDGALRALLAALAHSNAPHTLPRGLVKAQRMIEAEFHHPIQPVDIARACGMSPSYFSSLFRAHFNESPVQYLNRRRLELASQLLINPYNDIAGIARQCGFSDANYFARRFRAVYGTSPSGYRAKINHAPLPDYLKKPQSSH